MTKSIERARTRIIMKDGRIYGNISRSAIERKIEGKYGKYEPRVQKLSINETGV